MSPTHHPDPANGKPASRSSASRVALVTGAKHRLGHAIATALARQGHAIALHVRRTDEAATAARDDLRKLGVACELVEADLANDAACEALMDQAVQRMGRVDVLVNNASIFEHDTVDNFSAQRLMRHAQVNTVAPMVLMRALHRHLQSRRATGCAVNLLDQKLWNLNPDHLSYTLSKSMLRTATEVLAKALAPVLRVNAVAPGLTLGSPDIGSAALAKLQSQSLLGYGAQAEDIAQAVAYLASARAVTGDCILVDAGQHLQSAERDFAFMKP
jgi:NAD(P)-dependent dehydrogenase (short-subunit alcohol dehydrogenase family)